MPKLPSKSELVGVYEILKESHKLNEVAAKTDLKPGTIKMMFLGYKRMKPSVYEHAVKIADEYLERLESLNSKAKEINSKFQELKGTK